MSRTSTREMTVLVVATLASIAVLWAVAFVDVPPGFGWPEYPSEGFSLLARYWDGPPYLVVAASMYDPNDPVWAHYGRTFGEDWGAPQHAAHLIGYPALIRVLSVPFGYVGALLWATVASAVACMLGFFYFIRKLGLSRMPLLASCVFLVIPPRWILYHSLPASEPLFILFVLLSVVSFEKGKLWQCGLYGGLAAITRIFGILLLPAYILTWLLGQDASRRAPGRQLAWLLLIPLFLTIHFAWYEIQLGDFFAYFSQNRREMGLPFAGMFAFAAGNTVGGGSYGDIFTYLLLFYCLAWTYARGRRTLFWVALLLVVPAVCTRLHDITRFTIPSLALVLFPAMDEVFERRESRLAVLLCIPAMYLYAWRCVLENNLDPKIFEELSKYLRTL